MTTTPERDALAPKLENIISGHRINDDDAAWLRALLAASPAAGVPVQALKSDEWQGGLTNDELRAALQSKLRPGFTVDDDDLPLFALGIEYALAATPPAAAPAAAAAAASDEREALIEWTDSDGRKHSMTLNGATKTLRALYEEWPGGLNEIESSVKGLAALAARAPRPASDERRRFEDWLRSIWTPGYACPRDGDGYVDKRAQELWQAWRAGAALAPQAAAEGQAKPSNADELYEGAMTAMQEFARACAFGSDDDRVAKGARLGSYLMELHRLAAPQPTAQAEAVPCPFCGGEPSIVERPDNIDGTEFVYAVACYCGGYSACAHKLTRRRTPEQAKADTIAAWNTRAALAAAQPSGESK